MKRQEQKESGYSKNRLALIELTINPSLKKRGTYPPSLLKSKIPPFDRLSSSLSDLGVEDRVVTVRLRSPFNSVQGDPEFTEGSLSLSKVEGSEVEPLKAGRIGRGMSSPVAKKNCSSSIP